MPVYPGAPRQKWVCDALFTRHAGRDKLDPFIPTKEPNMKAARPSLVHSAFCVWVLAASIALSGTIALAQFESATLTGVVTDAAGAVVPGAMLRAVNEATNIEATAVSNGEGRYVLPSLRPGSYRVVATASGFKQFISSGVVLDVNQAARLDIQLTVGAVSEQVLVTGEAPVL